MGKILSYIFIGITVMFDGLAVIAADSLAAKGWGFPTLVIALVLSLTSYFLSHYYKISGKSNLLICYKEINILSL